MQSNDLNLMAGTATGITSEGPVKESLLSQSTVALHDELARLNNIIDTLESRLIPVCKSVNQIVGDNTKEQTEQVVSEVTSTVRTATVKVSQAISRVGSLLDRLDV